MSQAFAIADGVANALRVLPLMVDVLPVVEIPETLPDNITHCYVQPHGLDYAQTSRAQVATTVQIEVVLVRANADPRECVAMLERVAAELFSSAIHGTFPSRIDVSPLADRELLRQNQLYVGRLVIDYPVRESTP